jgi:hypothetical protein
MQDHEESAPAAAAGEGGGTGDPRVDQAIAALDGLAGLPPEQHVAVFEDIHGKLRQVLSELDTDSQPTDSGTPWR